jgi:hypothetical protein
MANDGYMVEEMAKLPYLDGQSLPYHGQARGARPGSGPGVDVKWTTNSALILLPGPGMAPPVLEDEHHA